MPKPKVKRSPIKLQWVDVHGRCNPVDAVTLVTNIPATVTELKCTNVAIARVLVCTRCMSCKAYNRMKVCNY
jgi:hypothetical protein